MEHPHRDDILLKITTSLDFATLELVSGGVSIFFLSGPLGWLTSTNAFKPS
jgi:hypothetical protein